MNMKFLNKKFLLFNLIILIVISLIIFYFNYNKIIEGNGCGDMDASDQDKRDCEDLKKSENNESKAETAYNNIQKNSANATGSPQYPSFQNN